MCQIGTRFLFFLMKLQAVKLLFPVTTPKFCGHFYRRKAQKQDKILIYIGKVVVGGTGLEPVTKAL